MSKCALKKPLNKGKNQVRKLGKWKCLSAKSTSIIELKISTLIPQFREYLDNS